jgi:ribosomal protein L29
MAKLIEDLRKLNKEELLEKKSANVSEYRKAKFALKSGDVSAENVNKARELKLEIARIETILKELEIVENESK